MKDDDKYSDILDYDWNYDSLPNRMPLSQRAKIFLPFAALTGFDEAIQNTINQEIADDSEYNKSGNCGAGGIRLKTSLYRNMFGYTDSWIIPAFLPDT